jgi:two-component system sensor histidine kinase KdpD
LITTGVRGTWGGRAELGRIGLAVLAVSAVSGVSLGLGLRGDLTNAVILYLFTIGLVSMRLGYRASLAAALVSAVSFDYFFLVPYHSLAVARGRDLLTMAAMLAVATFMNTLNERLRRQARAARQSERKTESLYGLVNVLAGASSRRELYTSAAREIESAVGANVRIMVRDAGGELTQVFGANGVVSAHTEDLPVAGWAASHLQPAGLGTRHAPTAGATYLPLVANRGCIGVVSVRRAERLGQPPGRPSSLLLAMVRQVAMAMERSLLAEEIVAAELDAETERIRNAVLSTVSHDLRSPLAIIGSASSTLLEHGDRLDAKARHEMAKIVNDEARRLNELLKSLLDVTRLESGGLTVNRDWESLEEVIGSVLGRVDESVGRHHLLTNVPSNVPLLNMDATLLEQVLVNLVDNALKYSGSDGPIEIGVAVEQGREVLVSVVDHGRGISESELTRVFDKFYRTRQHVGSGLGLGLTIARGIVQAHGGRMWASMTPGGGLTMQFTLPLGGRAPEMPEAELSTVLAGGMVSPDDQRPALP